MDQMRRELENYQTSHRSSSPAWASEFDSGIEDNVRLDTVFQGPKAGVLSPAEFARYQQIRANSVDRTASPITNASTLTNGYRPPMSMGYGMGMGMGMVNRPYGMMVGRQKQPEVEGKGKGRLVELDDTDWEAQFAQLETNQMDVDVEANAAIEAELSRMDRSVFPSISQVAARQ